VGQSTCSAHLVYSTMWSHVIVVMQVTWCHSRLIILFRMIIKGVGSSGRSRIFKRGPHTAIGRAGATAPCLEKGGCRPPLNPLLVGRVHSHSERTLLSPEWFLDNTEIAPFDSSFRAGSNSTKRNWAWMPSDRRVRLQTRVYIQSRATRQSVVRYIYTYL